MSVSLFLMSEKGFVVLKSLIDNQHSKFIDFVVTGTDKNVIDDYSDKIKTLCTENNIPVYGKNEDYVITSRYAIAISWRWLIPVRTGTRLIVIHDSLLPKYRGFAPLVNSLINREPYIGATAIFAAEEYDKGPIIAQSKTKISYPLTIHEAIQKVTKNYIELAGILMNKISQHETIASTPQNESQATYSLWRDEDDYRIQWNDSSDAIRRFIDAVGYPYKGASALFRGELIRITAAEPVEDKTIENRTPGKTIFFTGSNPVIVCGKGLLKITEAHYDKTGSPVLPIKKFRFRLT